MTTGGVPSSELVARAPLLGPMIGWTRAAGPGVMRSRIWARLDNGESEAPLAMITLAWDPRRGELVAGSALLWKIIALGLSKNADRRRLYIGLADVSLPVTDNDCVIRVVALHRCLRRDGGTVYRAFGAPEGPGGEGGRRGLVLGQPLAAFCEARTADEDTAGASSQIELAGPLLVEPGQAWPQPQTLALNRILPPEVFSDAATWLDGLAEEALASLAESEEASSRASAAWLAAAAPSLRKRRPPRLLEDCAASPGPAVRDSMAYRDKKTWEPAARRTLRFAAGSCRYPGTPFERDRADAALEVLAGLAGRKDGPAFAVFSGDQVYADATAGVFEVQGRREKVAARYESAFSAEAFRRLARRIPIYMTADDHEIADGWSLPRAQSPHLSQFEIYRNARLHEWAAQLFVGYQRIHGPPSQHGTGNWFHFSVAGVRFFMMDTRFERGSGPAGSAPPLCGALQLQALARWLQATPRHAPKVIVSGSVFAPGLAEWEDAPPSRCRSDTWQGYARERAAVARAVVEAGADNVVFLSGDYHCAAVASIQWIDSASGVPLPLRAWSVVTPSLYAPFPFANSRAEDVMLEEWIVDPEAPSSSRVVARCSAKAFDRSGCALISLTYGCRAPPELQVEFIDPHVAGRTDSMTVDVSEAWSPSRCAAAAAGL